MIDTSFDPGTGTGEVKPPKPQTTPAEVKPSDLFDVSQDVIKPAESFDVSQDVINNQRTVGSGGGMFKDADAQAGVVRDAYDQAFSDPTQTNDQQPTGEDTIMARQPTLDSGNPPTAPENVNPEDSGGSMRVAQQGEKALAEGQPKDALNSYLEDVISGVKGGFQESVREAGEAVSGQGQRIVGGGSGDLNPLERAGKILQALGVTPAMTILGTAFSPAQFAIGESLQNAVLVSPVRPRLEAAFRKVGLDPYGTENPTARIELTNQVLMDAYLNGTSEEANWAATLLVGSGYLQIVANGGLEMTATGVNLAKNLSRTAVNISKMAGRTEFAVSEGGAASRLSAFRDDRLTKLINEVAARDAIQQGATANPAAQIVPFVKKGEAVADESVFRPSTGEPVNLSAVRESRNKAPGQFEEKLSQLADESKGNLSPVDQERVANGLPPLRDVHDLTQDVLAGKTKYKSVSEMLDDIEAKANRSKLTAVDGGAGQDLVNPGASIEFKSYKADANGFREGGRFEPASGKIVINVPKPDPGYVQPFNLRSTVAVTAHELTHASQWIFKARMNPDNWMRMNDIERLPSQVQETVLRLLGVPEEALGTGPGADAFVKEFESKGLGGQIMDGLKKFISDESGGRGGGTPADTFLKDYADKALALRQSMPEGTLQALADSIRLQTKSPGQTMSEFFFGPQSERGKVLGPGAKDVTVADNTKIITDQLASGKRRVTAEDMNTLRTSTSAPIRGSSEDKGRSPLGGLTSKVFDKYQGAGGDNGIVKAIQQASGGRFNGIQDFGDAVKSLDSAKLQGMPEQLVSDFLTGYLEKGLGATGVGLSDDAIIAVAGQVAKNLLSGKKIDVDNIVSGMQTVGQVERGGQSGMKFVGKIPEGTPQGGPKPVPTRSPDFKNFSDDQLIEELGFRKRASDRAKQAYDAAKARGTGLDNAQSLDDAGKRSKGAGMRLSAIKKEMAARGLKDPDQPSSLPPSIPGVSGGKPEITAPNDGSRGPGGISGVGTDGHPAVGQIEQAIKDTEAEIAANPIGGSGGGKRVGGGGAGGPGKPGGPGPGSPKPSSVLINVRDSGLSAKDMEGINPDQMRLDMHIEGGLPKAIGGVVKGTNDFERSLMASSDASFTLNQGWYSLFTHQKEWGPAMIDQFRAMSSPEGAAKVNAEINQLPSINLARRAGLALDTSNEFFQSKLLESLPGIGKVVAAGDRAYTAAGNSLRARIYDTFANAWGLMEIESKGITIGPQYDKLMKEAKDLADWTNQITGVGTISEAKWLSLFRDNKYALFAAKFLASKVNIMTSPVAYLQQAIRGSLPSRLNIVGRNVPMPTYLPPGEASSWRMVGQAWRDTVLFYGGVGMSMASLKAMGLDVGTDPEADNFGTVTVGKSTFDLTGGTGRLFSLIWQTTLARERVTSSGRVVDLNNPGYGDENATDLWTRFLAGKLAPLGSQGYQLFSGKNFQKEQPNVWDLLPLPISAKQFIGTFFDEQWKSRPEIMLGALINFAGAREYTRDTQTKPSDFKIGDVNVPTGALGEPIQLPSLPNPFRGDQGYKIPMRTR